MADNLTAGLLVQLERQDARLLDFLVVRRHRLLDCTLRLLTHLGDAASVLSITAALALLPAYRPAARVAVPALIISHLLVQLLKRSVSRPRPRLPAGVAMLVRAPDRFSFPSGHAAAALSLAVALARVLAPGEGMVVVATGLLVGVSRCYLGVHYPGDVMAGWLLALLGIVVGAGL
jgi:undecaprenyl-diphosphatase